MTQPPPSLQNPSIRRCAAELLAYAIGDVLPQATVLDTGITDIGFYCDIGTDQQVDDGVLALVEQRLRTVIKASPPLKTMEMVRDNAAELFRHHRLDAQIARIEESTDQTVAILAIGDRYYGVCPEPHIATTEEVGVAKVLGVQPGCRRDAEEHGVARIYRFTATALPDQKQLKAFLKRMEQAKRRDHRVLGRQLDLFSTSDESGPGLWFWHPKGATIREMLLDWWRSEHRKQRFQTLATPRIVKPSLLQQAGWYDFADEKAAVFPPFSSEGVDYVLTPTNVPLHAQVFRSRLHSYREFPIRYAECAQLYHHGKASQLWGMLKARAYLADNAYLFCTPEQVLEELISSLQFIDRTVRIFGFQHVLYLSARSAQFAGTVAEWERGMQWIAEALEACGFDYQVEEGHATGSQAFYGPRVDVRLIDALGREWSGPFVGLDFNHPERFGLRYQGKDDAMHVPLMLTRSMFGSLERFVAILVEHYGGHFPLWLAPEQVRVLPVTEDQADYAAEVAERLLQEGFRVHVDYRREVLRAKVHSFEESKVPYAIVVGRREQEDRCITYRRSQEGKVTEGVELDEMIAQLHRETEDKELPGAAGTVESR